MANQPRDTSGAPPEWDAADLRRALIRRANFAHAGQRSRRAPCGLAHAGVPRRAIRRIGERAAAALQRSGRWDYAGKVVADLAAGPYHDERILALEIVDRLADPWPDWAVERLAELSRSLRHPWMADRLARAQGRLLLRRPDLMRRHIRWAFSQNPLRRRAAVRALLPDGAERRFRRIPAARAVIILRLLLNDPEFHRWVQTAVGQVLLHYAARAPRTVARLLENDPPNLLPRHREIAQRLLAKLPSAS